MVATWSPPSLGLMKVCFGGNCDPSDPEATVEDRSLATRPTEEVPSVNETSTTEG